MQYIVQEPFPGYIQSIVRADGTVGWTDGVPLAEYLAGRPNMKVVGETELDALFAEHEANMCGNIQEISEEDWDYALNVLPPLRWTHELGVEVFAISEATSGCMHSWYARLNGRCFTSTERIDVDLVDFATRIKKFAQTN